MLNVVNNCVQKTFQEPPLGTRLGGTYHGFVFYLWTRPFELWLLITAVAKYFLCIVLYYNICSARAFIKRYDCDTKHRL